MGVSSRRIFMGLPSPLSSASKYKCAKLTLPAAPARALQFPEVVARLRRVATERVSPFCVQDHALEAAALRRPAPQEKAQKKSLTKHPSLDARIATRRAAAGEEFKY